MKKGKSTSSSAGAHHGLEDPDFLKKRRASIMLKGDYSPRDLFLHLEPQALEDMMAALKEGGSTLTGGALRNHAATMLWTPEKEKEYASKVDPTAEDIDA